MKVHTDFVQYSPEFWEARRGKPSASNFHRFIDGSGKLSKGRAKDSPLSKGAASYIHELIADRVRFDPPFLTEKPASAAMREGTEREPESRRWYEYEHNCTLQQVGGCETDCGRFWFSPDALIVVDGEIVGGLELKNPEPKTHVSWLLAGELPDDHLAQVHGSLWCAHLEFWAFVSYCPPFKPLVVKVLPTEFTRNLGAALEEFYLHYRASWEQFQKVNA